MRPCSVSTPAVREAALEQRDAQIGSSGARICRLTADCVMNSSSARRYVKGRDCGRPPRKALGIQVERRRVWRFLAAFTIARDMD